MRIFVELLWLSAQSVSDISRVVSCMACQLNLDRPRLRLGRGCRLLKERLHFTR